MLSGRKIKDITKKVIPFLILQHLVAFHQILFNPYNSGMRIRNIYRYLKWHLYNKPFGKIAYANLINGYRTIVFPDSDSGVSDIYLPNEYHNLTFIRNQLAQGSFIIDAGCNVGNRTLALADKIRGALLVDANKLSLLRLRGNFKLNHIDLKNYTIENAALGEDTGEIFFTDIGGSSTQNKVIANETCLNEEAGVTKVRMTTIDEEMKKIGNPECRFIKTDVEGYDLFALRGAVNTLTRNSVRLVMFERWENIPLDEFIVFFEGISWRVFSIDEEFNLAGFNSPKLASA